ncbi:MAG: anaerobic sulfatase maturase [Bacteroidales bacterium]|nr:anaerobic sulfatase maturase [Bacteroidales bacterium]
MKTLPVISDFQIFVKPVGALCNLHCSYCYYIEKQEMKGLREQRRMPDDVLEMYIRQHIDATREQLAFFSWHGGEPLLAGIDFYRKALALQQKYAPTGKTIINGIQTNGTLINEQWCSFLAEADFEVGISLDGPEHLHNTFRLTQDGGETFKRVLRGFDLLVMHGIDPEMLCVVNAVNVKYPLEVYRFFRHLGVPYITFIPLVEPANTDTKVSDRSVNPEDFGRFLCAIFDEWLEKDIGRVKVQIFEEALRTAFKQEHTLCIFKPECGRVPVIEQNGDFYSCDHFVNPQFRLGNIGDTTLEHLLESDAQKTFGRAKSVTLPQYCRNCEVLDMCHGECPKNRFIAAPNGEPGLNYLCAGYKMFFKHCRPFVDAVAMALYR